MSDTDTDNSTDNSSAADHSEDRASEASDSLSEASRDALSGGANGDTGTTTDTSEPKDAEAELAASQDRLANEGRAAKDRVEREMKQDQTVVDALDQEVAALNETAAREAVVDAIQSGMAHAQANPMPAGSYQVAQTTTMPGQTGLPDIDLPNLGRMARAATPAGAAVAAAIGLERVNDIASQAMVQSSAAELGLDLGTVEGVLAAEAHAATSYNASASPLSDWSTGISYAAVEKSGPTVDIAAQAVALNELANPGTYRAATQGDTEAQAQIESVMGEAVAAYEANALTPVDGEWAQGWAESYPALTEAEQRLGELPGFTPAQIEEFQEQYPAETFDLPNHTGGAAPVIEGLDIISTPISDMDQAIILENRRYEPGVATGQGQPVGADWMRQGVINGGAPIPEQIADRLRDREFASFDTFREAFWQEVAADRDLASQFNSQNRSRMASGLAPRAPVSEHVGDRASFELDHIEALFRGGEVYDADNLQVMTPAAHIEKTRND
jgi:hypothetical protein